MPITAVLGMQWGDEGKGKIVDTLAGKADVVARFAGGGNAGHTVFRGEKIYRLHHLPVGILHEHVDVVLGNGMVIHPETLQEELRQFPNARVYVSDKAHVVTDEHMEQDAQRESYKQPLGTTKRGIGPAYADKAYRTGMRMGDFAQSHNPLAEFYLPFVCDTTELLNDFLSEGKHIIAEGAQGTLLDIDHGTYPYVSSSSCTIGGVFTGLGIAPRHLTRTIGVVKAFQTRIGTGPFPSEVKGETLERLRGDGSKPTDEFGATTGRPRRCGWLDIDLLRYAIRINGVDELALTKLDALTGIARLYVRHNNDYLLLPGWHQDISNCTKYLNLPREAKKYVENIEELCGVPINMISVGPQPEQVIIK